MLIHTDDDARKLRYRWLGPIAIRMPFDFTGPQWAAGGAGAVLVLVTTAFVVRPPMPALLFLGLWVAALLVAFGALWLIGLRIGKYVNGTDTSIAYHVGVLVAETTALRERLSPTTRTRTLTSPRAPRGARARSNR